MKRYLIALSLLAIAGCSSSDSEDSTMPTPAAESSVPPPAPPPQPVQAPPVAPSKSANGSTIALPPIANANPAPEPPSATGSLRQAPPSNFDTQAFVEQGRAPKSVRSAPVSKPGATIAPGANATVPAGQQPVVSSAPMQAPAPVATNPPSP